MGKKIIISGATGMIGTLVLRLCLENREMKMCVSLEAFTPFFDINIIIFDTV
jgi:hypothetical protein